MRGGEQMGSNLIWTIAGVLLIVVLLMIIF
jgi:hypothetical protein